MYQRILVPVDGSSTSNRGLAEAIDIVKFTHGRLCLVHVIDELSFALAMDAYSGYAGDWLNVLREKGAKTLAAAKATAQAAGVEADTHLHDSFSSKVHEVVAAEAVRWQADLIVLGTHGRRGVGRLVMGSSAEQIVRCAAAPVLLVREAAAALQSEPAPERILVSLPSAALGFE